MLCTKLKTIYGQKGFLEKNYPFDEYFPYLRLYLSNEVKLGARYINPYRFAESFSLDLKRTLNFFISLRGKESLFETYFQVTCEQCGTPKILKEETFSFEELICDECYETIDIPSDLNTVKLLFKLDEDIIRELKNDSKKASSSFDDVIALKEEPTLKEALKIDEDEDERLKAEKNKMMKRLSFNYVR